VTAIVAGSALRQRRRRRLAAPLRIPHQRVARVAKRSHGEHMMRPHLSFLRNLKGFVRYFVLGSDQRVEHGA